MAAHLALIAPHQFYNMYGERKGLRKPARRGMNRRRCDLPQAGLLISAKELETCQGVAFAILHKPKTYCGPLLLRGNGFVVGRRPKNAPSRSKLFIHWADDTFRPGLR